MSDPVRLSDTVGASTIVTTLAPEGDRWLSVVTGGALDTYQASMSASGDPQALHQSVIATVTEARDATV